MKYAAIGLKCKTSFKKFKASVNFGETFKNGKRLLESLYKNVKCPAQTEKSLANEKPYCLKPSKKKMLPFLRGIFEMPYLTVSITLRLAGAYDKRIGNATVFIMRGND